MLVSPGFRKRPGNKGSLVPVLVVERFEVFDGRQSRFPAGAGRDLMLFPGFQLDLDTGQIVPEGLGGDIVFTARGEEDGTIRPLGAARLATLSRPPICLTPRRAFPRQGKVVRPADFSGRFRLAANGQWSGLLELAVDPAGSGLRERTPPTPADRSIP